MELVKALETMEIQLNDVRNLNKGALQKRYRQLMKKHHPDLGGSDEKSKDINEAYEVLSNNIDKLPKLRFVTVESQVIKEKPPVRLRVPTLLDILAGKKMKFVFNGETYEIHKDNLNDYRIFIQFLLKITYKSRENNDDSLVETTVESDITTVYSESGKYTTGIKICIDKPEKLTVKANIEGLGNSVCINLDNRFGIILLNLGYNIVIRIEISKVVKTDGIQD